MQVRPCGAAGHAHRAEPRAGRDALTGARAPATRAVATTQSPVPATRKSEAAPARASRKAAPADDDDLKDIEDILRKRGI